MEFYIKMSPKATERLRSGNEVRIDIGNKPVWVTVIRIEEDKIFVKAEGEDEKYLQDLYEVKAKANSSH